MGVVLRAVGEWLWWVPVDERVHGEGGAERGDVIDVVVEFEVALELESEEFSGAFVFKGDVVDLKFNVGEGSWVEGSVGGLGGVRDKVVVVEVGDEIVELVLGVFLEGVEIGCRDDKCGVVGVREGVGEGCCVADVCRGGRGWWRGCCLGGSRG